MATEMSGALRGRAALGGTVRWAIPLLALIAGLCTPLLVDSEQGRLPGQLGVLGIVALAANLGLSVYPWLGRKGWRGDMWNPLRFISVLFLLVFVARPLQILLDPEARSRAMPDGVWLFEQALMLGGLGVSCLYFGYRARIGDRLARKLPSVGERWRGTRVAQVAAAYLVVGLTGYAVAIARSGGPASFVRTLGGRRLLAASGNWVFASSLVLVHAAALLVGTHCFQRKRLRGLFVLSVVLSVATSLSLGGRSAVLVPLLALMVAHAYSRSSGDGRGWSLRRAALIGGAAATAVIFAVVLRAARTEGLAGRAVSLEPLSLLVGGDAVDAFLGEFNQFDWLVVVLKVFPRELPLQLGGTLLHFFAMWIPRALWADKPLPISFVISRAVTGVATGQPSTIIGELFLNYHLPGVVVGMAAFGVFLKVAHSYLRHNRASPGAILVYAFTFASLHELFTRTLAPKAFAFTLFMVPAIVAVLLVQQRRSGVSTAAIPGPAARGRRLR
jgi:oligosaccharide repeat unit polymerase